MRKHCLIQEAIYWYNSMPKDDMSHPTAPANTIHTYEVRLKGIDAVHALTPWTVHKTYKVGDVV